LDSAAQARVHSYTWKGISTHATQVSHPLVPVRTLGSPDRTPRANRTRRAPPCGRIASPLVDLTRGYQPRRTADRGPRANPPVRDLATPPLRRGPLSCAGRR